MKTAINILSLMVIVLITCVTIFCKRKYDLTDGEMGIVLFTDFFLLIAFVILVIITNERK